MAETLSRRSKRAFQKTGLGTPCFEGDRFFGHYAVRLRRPPLALVRIAIPRRLPEMKGFSYIDCRRNRSTIASFFAVKKEIPV